AGTGKGIGGGGIAEGRVKCGGGRGASCRWGVGWKCDRGGAVVHGVVFGGQPDLPATGAANGARADGDGRKEPDDRSRRCGSGFGGAAGGDGGVWFDGPGLHGDEPSHRGEKCGGRFCPEVGGAGPGDQGGQRSPAGCGDGTRG